jgi:metal-responsive CopG/Arc/MetJ family transcriptional regulator
MARTEGKTLVTLELSTILLGNLDVIASNKGLNRSEILRCLIDDYIDKNREIYLK